MFRPLNAPTRSVSNDQPAASVVDAATIAAYRETDYHVHHTTPFVLRVDMACGELAALYKKTRTDCCAYMTACNPFGRQLGEADNKQRQALLVQALKGRGLHFIAGIGQHPREPWPGEPSFLVLGLSLEAAKMLGRNHEQNAIVWCGADMVALLVLLR